MAKDYFPKVKEAKALLVEKAKEILEQYLLVCAEARNAGDFEVATRSLQWLMEHMPEEEGVKMLEPSVDTKAIEKGSSAPTIQIGIALGSKARELPPSNVIDIDDEA